MANLLFAEVALRNAGRHFRVFPVRQGTKEPCIKSFPDLATTDSSIIKDWASKFPHANCGVMGDDVHLIIDTDRWDKLRELFAEQIATDPTLFDTYCVSARENRRQFVFLQTERSLSMRKRNLDYAVPGEPDNVFEFKSRRKFGMGEGSLHKTGSLYSIVQDRPVKPVPDSLVDRAEQLAESRRESTNGEVLRLEPGSRHDALVSKAGVLRRAGFSTATIEAALLQHCSENLQDDTGFNVEDECAKIARSATWPVPPPEPRVVFGGSSTNDAIGSIADRVPHPAYPDEVWNGTLFGEFADIVCRDNFIPKKFASESFRVLTGALVGDQLTCGIGGVRMREYLTVIGLRQSGKSWAKDCAVWFYTRPCAGFLFEPLLFQGGSSRYRSLRIGAQQFLPGSPNSFVDELTREDRKQKPTKEPAIEVAITDRWDPVARYVTIQGEAMSLFARFGNDWTGQALSALVTDLYDGTEVEVAVTKERGAPKVPVRLQYSMMLYTQPLIWRKHMAEHVMDSGLFGRFYIVGSEQEPKQVPLPDYEKDADLFQYHFGDLRREMFSRIDYLAEHPVLMQVAPEAKRKIHQWLDSLASKGDGIDRSSRMGLHVYRAAMARAWAAGKQRLEISVEDADAAILLGQYQVQQREYYAPVLGDDPKARALNLVRQTIRNAGQLGLRELKHRVHSDRFSERFEWSLDWLQKHKEVAIRDEGRGRKTIAWVKEDDLAPAK